jgi:hypothetical protein
VNIGLLGLLDCRREKTVSEPSTGAERILRNSLRNYYPSGFRVLVALIITVFGLPVLFYVVLSGAKFDGHGKELCVRYHRRHYRLLVEAISTHTLPRIPLSRQFGE